jgi:hypothetical protein
MFTKALVGGKELKFMYAPPQTDLDLRKGPDGKLREQKRLPQASRVRTDKFRRSVYYYWWAFLRLNEDYIETCNANGQGLHAELYRDFGDVRDGVRPTYNNDGDHFKAWWVERGAFLFAEPNDVEKPRLLSDGSKYDLQSEVAVVVPFTNDFTQTISELQRLLETKYDEFYEARGSSSFALYTVANGHTLPALEFSLQLKIAEAKYQKVFDRKAKLSELAVIASNPDAYQYDKAIEVNDDDARLRSAARAARDRANIWIKNVVLGRFPDNDFHEHKVVRLPSPEIRRMHLSNMRMINESIGRARL